MIEEIKTLVKNAVGHEYLYLDQAAVVETMHTDFSVWALCVSPSGDLYIMDQEQQWCPVAPQDEIFMQPLRDRVRAICDRYRCETLKQPSI